LPTNNWTTTQLADLTAQEEIVLVLERADRPVLRVPVWLVRIGDFAYVRSYQGVTTGWYRSAIAQRDQAIERSDGDIPVVFESIDPADDINAEISDAYVSKYSTHDYRDAMITPIATEATLRVVPR
jgi:hypothetical protein